MELEMEIGNRNENKQTKKLLVRIMTGLMSHSKEPVWKYFNCELDESGTPVDPNRIVCYMCAPHKT